MLELYLLETRDLKNSDRDVQTGRVGVFFVLRLLCPGCLPRGQSLLLSSRQRPGLQ